MKAAYLQLPTSSKNCNLCGVSIPDKTVVFYLFLFLLKHNVYCEFIKDYLLLTVILSMHQAQIPSQMHEITFSGHTGRPGEIVKRTALDRYRSILQHSG